MWGFARFFATSTAAFLLALLGVVGPLPSGMVLPSLTNLRDVGMSAGVFGAMIASFPRKRVLLLLELLMLGAKFFVFLDLAAESVHPIALVLGFELERIWRFRSSEF